MFSSKNKSGQACISGLNNFNEAEHLSNTQFDGSVYDQKSKQQCFLSRVDSVLKRCYVNCELRVKDVANSLYISERSLSRKLKSETALAPSDYIKNYRLNQAKKMLLAGGKPGSVSFEVGFSSHSYFTRCFKERYYLPPSEYTRLGDFQHTLPKLPK